MLEERIAVLETKVSSLEEQNHTILEKLDSIDSKITKARGFMGGVIFVVSSIATFLSIILTGKH